MAKICDHTSVGMLVWKDDTLLLIERKNKPFGFAPPAGHVDGDTTYEEAAIRELKEEVGFDTKDIKLTIEGRKENPCKREDGNWHHWKIYSVEVSGTMERSEEETKQAHFYTKDEIHALGEKTQKYLRGEINENKWEQSPGIEPVWYEWLQELKII